MELDLPYYIRSDVSGLERIAALAAKILNEDGAEVTLNASRLGWLDANLLAAVGVILACARSAGKMIHSARAPREDILAIMKRNLFHCAEFGDGAPAKTEELLSRYRFKSYLPYCRFDREESRDFKDKYIKAFVADRFVPFVDEIVQTKVRECLMELFDNAKNHSESSLGVFVCGQQYPIKKRLRLTIADAGVGFAGCYERRFGKSVTSRDAIEWAMQPEAHSVRKNIPGGNGLQVLQGFVKSNGGTFSILSGSGLWFMDAAGTTLKELETAFPGTMATVEFDTSREGAYSLRDRAFY